MILLTGRRICESLPFSLVRRLALQANGRMPAR
jgi:hypothetical protein